MRLLAALALITFASSASAADIKFGVVDVARAFQEFYKTKDATAVMKGNRDKVAQDMNERYAAYKTKVADVQTAQKKGQDPILTPEGRAKAQADFNVLLKEVRSMEQEISEFQQRRSMQLRQEEMDLQKGIYQEIAEVVQKKAKADNYDFVFDKSGAGINSVPILLHHKGATDFTDEVVVELNKNAPASGSAKGEDKKVEDKAKSK